MKSLRFSALKRLKQKIRAILCGDSVSVTKNRVIAPDFVWDQQPFFRQADEKYGKIPGIKDLRLFFLQSCIRSLENLDGDIAECGVRNGKSTLFMFDADKRKRNFFFFDSFEGLSDPTPTKDSLESSFRPGQNTRFFMSKTLTKFWEGSKL